MTDKPHQSFGSPEELLALVDDMTNQMLAVDGQMRGLVSKENHAVDQIKDWQFRLKQIRMNKTARRNFVKERAAMTVRAEMGVEVIVGMRSKYLSTKKFFQEAKRRRLEARESAQKVIDDSDDKAKAEEEINEDPNNLS